MQEMEDVEVKKEKNCALLLYAAAVGFYLAAAITFINRSNTSMGVVWIALGSAMLCFGSAKLNGCKKKQKSERE